MKDSFEKIRALLVPLWPSAVPLLHYSSCFELLCAVILSAQCTDEQVNSVTPQLFAAYPTPHAMAQADLSTLEAIIHSVGFFRTKAKHLIETAKGLIKNYEGKVPSDMTSLLSLPGVGRKTANLVLSACFGVPGIIVDTHVMRVAVRLGMSGKKDPAIIEKIIRSALDPKYYTAFSHALNRHGKFVCKAKNPACCTEQGLCPLEALCPKIGIVKPEK